MEPIVKRPFGFDLTWFMLAFMSHRVALDFAHFEYHLLRDPFSAVKFAIDIGTFIGFALFYRVVLAYFWKAPR